MKTKVYIYKTYERFWHWTQSFLVFILIFTGFEVHGSFTFFGYEQAVKYHKIAAYAFIILIAFTIFWHITTGEWKQYLPTKKNLKAQLNYYIFGIFRNEPHPTKKTTLSKLNPLQKLVYFGLKILVIPVLVLSGILYLFFRYPQRTGTGYININSLEPIAIIHTAGAYLLLAFVIAHLYLITTGTTLTSNLKAMITGYEEIETDEKNIEEEKSDDKTKNNKQE